MMTKIILYGKLAKIYGKEFSFANIHKPSDVVNAMETIHPGFRRYIINQTKEGMNYEIILDGETGTAYGLNEKKSPKIVEIAPSIIGQDPITILIALGAAIAYAGFVMGVTTIVGGILFSLGVGLILAGIAYLLTPIPENEPDEAGIRSGIKNASFLFQNPQNISTQGKPIPIGYGRLRVGSLVVGTTLSNFDLSDDRQNTHYETAKTEALLKIQESFGSSVSNYIRGY